MNLPFRSEGEIAYSVIIVGHCGIVAGDAYLSVRARDASEAIRPYRVLQE